MNGKSLSVRNSRLDDHKAIGFKWVFAIKYDSDGTINRYKARLCAQGFSQVPGLDYNETFAPVARFTTVRVFLAIAAARDYELRHFDVSTAFLHGKLEEEVYMKVPDGVTVPIGSPPNTVLRLNRAIYGIKQASRVWNQNLHKTLTELGFSRSPYDYCLYVRVEDGVFCAMTVVVDDLVIACSNTDYISTLYRSLSLRYKIKDEGDLRV